MPFDYLMETEYESLPVDDRGLYPWKVTHKYQGGLAWSWYFKRQGDAEYWQKTFLDFRAESVSIVNVLQERGVNVKETAAS